MFNVEFTLSVLSLLGVIAGSAIDRIYFEEPSAAEETIQNFRTQKGDCL